LDGKIWALKANSLTSPLTVTVTVTVNVKTIYIFTETVTNIKTN